MTDSSSGTGGSPGTTSAELCSVLARNETLAATAPVAQSWLIIEQPGPWGAKALTSSDLDPDIGAALVQASAGTGTTICLARSITARENEATQVRVWLAHTSPGDVRLRVGHVELSELLDIDFSAMAAGDLPKIGERSTEPFLFVCTNGKRDLCCAIKGRDLLRELITDASATDVLEYTYEVSHLGGHRFAPTALLLPHGAVFGRLTQQSAVKVLRRAREGHLHTEHYRGRSTWRPWEQAAEIAVRNSEHITNSHHIDVLRVVVDGLGREHVVPTRTGPGGLTPEQAVLEVRHRDGRAWRVQVHSEAIAERPESCSKVPVAGHTWRAHISATSSWRSNQA